jgi:hypothetical protein
MNMFEGMNGGGPHFFEDRRTCTMKIKGMPTTFPPEKS